MQPREVCPPRIEMLEPRLLLGAGAVLAEPFASAQVMDVAAAGAVTVNGTVARPGQSTMYQLTTKASGMLNIDMMADGSSVDSFIQVYNGNGWVWYQNDNTSWKTKDAGVGFYVSADQTYYVKAAGTRNTTGDYTLKVTSTPTDDHKNTPAAATRLWLWNGSGTASGQINYAGDVDVFSFVANKTGVMTVEMAKSGWGNTLVGDLYACNAQEVQIAHDDGADGKVTVKFSVTSGQTYYVKAGSLNNTTGGYSLNLTTADPPAPPLPPPPPDGYVPGTIITTQTVTLASGLQLVVLGTNGADVLTLGQASDAVTLTTSSGTRNIAGQFVSMQVYGFGGNDTISINSTVTRPVTVYGGDGNDSLFDAGKAADTDYGGAGDDLLVSVGGGADKVYGDAGLDSFWVDATDTLPDASTAENAATAVHRISQFYQPVSGAASQIPLEIEGQRLIDPKTNYSYVNFASRPLFVDGPEYNDIRQGYLGDCYFLASLASLADQDPGLVRQMIAPMGDGTFAVRFYRNGTPTYLRVDADLPASGFSPVYAKLTPDGELWVALAEKAYAQFRYNQNSYDSLSGGWMNPVYREVTNAAASDTWITSTTAGLASYLTNQLAAGHAVTAATVSSPSGPVVGQHAYMVKTVETANSVTYVTVYNPWGYDGKGTDANTSDGLVKLTLAQFQANFFAVTVCMA